MEGLKHQPGIYLDINTVGHYRMALGYPTYKIKFEKDSRICFFLCFHRECPFLRKNNDQASF